MRYAGALLASALVVSFAAACNGGPGEPQDDRATVTPRQASTPAAAPYLADGPGARGNREGAGPRVEPASEPAPPPGGRFRAPVALPLRVVSHFGEPRADGQRHVGIDVEGVDGEEVASACAGSVVFTGLDDRRGQHVIIDCGEGWATLHAYLGELLVGQGEPVEQGQLVGRIDGTLGFVHFELHWQGIPVALRRYVELGEPTPTPTPTSAPEQEEETPTPSPTATPTPTASAEATATPAPATPTATPTPPTTPTPTRTPTPAPPTATPTPTPTPLPPTPTPTPTRPVSVS